MIKKGHFFVLQIINFYSAVLRIPDIRVMYMALSCRKEAKACQCLCNRGSVPQARQRGGHLLVRSVMIECDSAM